jgi:hypothetical protein
MSPDTFKRNFNMFSTGVNHIFVWIDYIFVGIVLSYFLLHIKCSQKGQLPIFTDDSYRAPILLVCWCSRVFRVDAYLLCSQVTVT